MLKGLKLLDIGKIMIIIRKQFMLNLKRIIDNEPELRNNIEKNQTNIGALLII